jgi:hypothetical protein
MCICLRTQREGCGVQKGTQIFLKPARIQFCSVTASTGAMRNDRSDITHYGHRRLPRCEEHDSSLLAGIRKTVTYNTS